MSAIHQSTAAIVGITGYEGAGVARLIAHHPYLRLIEVTARTSIGQTLAEVLPAFTGSPIANLTITETANEAELIFLAIPHGPAATLAAQYQAQGRRVIDISADFRLNDPAIYAQWYGHAHPAPQLLPQSVYGLTEWQRQSISEAQIIANPGCFPTSALLALLPAFSERLINPEVIIDAKTGVSGAGRSPSRRVHFVEVEESITAYGLQGHRHLPEIEQELTKASDPATPPNVTFIPHLVPMKRGILSTCYATLQPHVTAAQVYAHYKATYADEPFVHVIDQVPETGWVQGSNLCLLTLHIDEAKRRLIIISAIDNLMKGGAGQAVQNANVLFGYPEITGLEREGVWP